VREHAVPLARPYDLVVASVIDCDNGDVSAPWRSFPIGRFVYAWSANTG
jgi:hypothetical protein